MKVLNYCNMHIKNKVTYLYIISSIMYIHSGDYIYNKENYTINNSLITPITDNNKNYINPEYKTNNIEDYLCQYYNENTLLRYISDNIKDENEYISEKNINYENEYNINKNNNSNIKNENEYISEKNINYENEYNINKNNNSNIKKIFKVEIEEDKIIKNLKNKISLKKKRRTKDQIKDDGNKNINIIENNIKNQDKKIKKKHGRKQKKTLIENHYRHTKIANDNIVKKINHLVISNFRNFINKKILDNNKVNENDYKDTKKGLINKTALNKIIKNKNIRILYKINPKILINSNVEHNQKFIYKTMKEILSSDISKKYKKKENYNESLINDLIEHDNQYKKIFEFTFLKVLNYYIEKEEYDELEGMEKYKEDKKQNDEYNKRIIAIMKGYETFSNNIRFKRNNKKNK